MDIFYYMAQPRKCVETVRLVTQFPWQKLQHYFELWKRFIDGINLIEQVIHFELLFQRNTSKFGLLFLTFVSNLHWLLTKFIDTTICIDLEFSYLNGSVTWKLYSVRWQWNYQVLGCTLWLFTDNFTNQKCILIYVTVI